MITWPPLAEADAESMCSSTRHESDGMDSELIPPSAYQSREVSSRQTSSPPSSAILAPNALTRSASEYPLAHAPGSPAPWPQIT